MIKRSSNKSTVPWRVRAAGLFSRRSSKPAMQSSHGIEERSRADRAASMYRTGISVQEYPLLVPEVDLDRRTRVLALHQDGGWPLSYRRSGNRQKSIQGQRRIVRWRRSGTIDSLLPRDGLLLIGENAAGHG